MFDLIFGHQFQGPLRSLKEKWKDKFKNLLESLISLEMVQHNLKAAKIWYVMKCWYDKDTA